jgi:hypothetical protein
MQITTITEFDKPSGCTELRDFIQFDKREALRDADLKKTSPKPSAEEEEEEDSVMDDKSPRDGKSASNRNTMRRFNRPRTLRRKSNSSEALLLTKYVSLMFQFGIQFSLFSSITFYDPLMGFYCSGTDAPKDKDSGSRSPSRSPAPTESRSAASTKSAATTPPPPPSGNKNCFSLLITSPGLNIYLLRNSSCSLHYTSESTH